MPSFTGFADQVLRLMSNGSVTAIAERNTSSCAAKAFRMRSASVSHRPVEPSTSVNRNVTTPEGEPPSWHRLGPGDMPLEAKGFRHVAVTIPEIRVSRGIAMSLR